MPIGRGKPRPYELRPWRKANVMNPNNPKNLNTVSVDEATKTAIEEDIAAAKRGEIVSKEQARIIVRQRYQDKNRPT